ncbi:PAAR domain-containing protein [Paraburkholderia sediminicola]|uniref:PAAR domain-containing protein n=1 Tax=Paraburkholderia sediminicola TaxID=458836 RepID=UPI0038BABF24
MKRSYLKLGDKSSAGGTVMEGIPLMNHDGTELTFVGATVTCPACKDSGHIVAKGPRWPGDLMGKQAALEGDVCACKCYPLPVMLASQSDMTMSFESHELAGMGFAANGSSLTEKEASEHWIKFALNEKGGCEGLGCRAHFADGSIEHGTFDAENEVHFERPNSSPCQKVELVNDYEKPSGSLVESLLSAMAG